MGRGMLKDRFPLDRVGKMHQLWNATQHSIRSSAESHGSHHVASFNESEVGGSDFVTSTGSHQKSA